MFDGLAKIQNNRPVVSLFEPPKPPVGVGIHTPGHGPTLDYRGRDQAALLKWLHSCDFCRKFVKPYVRNERCAPCIVWESGTSFVRVRLDHELVKFRGRTEHGKLLFSHQLLTALQTLHSEAPPCTMQTEGQQIFPGKAYMARCVLTRIGLLLFTAASCAQQSTKPDLQITAAVTAKGLDNAEVSVQLHNRSEHAIRIPVRGFLCADMPGWISAHLKFTAPADQSRSEAESGSRGCGISVGVAEESDVVGEAALWKLLAPGESLEIRDEFAKLIPGSIQPGTYTFRVVYNGEDLTQDQQRKLAAAGISTPFGKLESNELVFKIGRDHR